MRIILPTSNISSTLKSNWSLISTKTWNSNYKDQLLLRVEDMLEVGNMIRTNNGGYSVPFKISDVDSIVTIVSDRDE